MGQASPSLGPGNLPVCPAAVPYLLGTGVRVDVSRGFVSLNSPALHGLPAHCASPLLLPEDPSSRKMGQHCQGRPVQRCPLEIPPIVPQYCTHVYKIIIMRTFFFCICYLSTHSWLQFQLQKLEKQMYLICFA